jgi:hypothetical protein
MKHCWTEFSDIWRCSPMTIWVHRAADGEPWYRAKRFDPPAPQPVPGRGYPYFFVEIDGFTFEFASLEEIDFCIVRLNHRHLPDTERETRGVSGPGSYWQNKLPKGVLSWRYRQKAVKYLSRSRAKFERSLSALVQKR